ncbi:MAG: hypothetical protein K2X98_04380 [Alphaproteobacteria bacterium]|nr:hypothetical protein [Alphaproteobacteria bacterium]MBX9977462.1 hypothetical protein [Alphaproteobacteria bacterium]
MIIILHSTQLAENLGAVARIMGNFALRELRLITPHIMPIHPKAMATAAGAETILEQARIYDSLADATTDITHLFGTCADERQGIRHYMGPEKAFSDMMRFDAIAKIGVLFGCERTGLSQEDMSYCRATIQIPVNPSFSSMNLSHAVGIIAYERFKADSQPVPHIMHMGSTKSASCDQKQALFNHLIHLLDEVAYWRVDAKKPLMQQNLANFFFRMDLTEQEIQTLFGVFNSLYRSKKLP